MKKVLIAPSILNADPNNLVEDIQKVALIGADWIHIDVMDGKFVPNTTFNIETIKKITQCHSLVNDVHIMIENPIKYALDYINAGADYLTFHLEACKNENEVNSLIDLIKSHEVKVGVSIKPKTNVEEIFKYLDKIDLILIMSVEPGFGGQSFILDTLQKVKILRKRIDKYKYNCLIEIDGGINNETSKFAKDCGVDVLVSGSYLFGHSDIKERIKLLK